tara:strand:- start:24767 stop:25579 length:813 start_codon:yes stop_codon:yes gene_type:complete
MILQERIKKYKGKKINGVGITSATMSYKNKSNGSQIGKFYIDLTGDVFKSITFRYTGKIYINEDFAFDDGYVVKQSPKSNTFTIYNILRKPFKDNILFEYYGILYSIDEPYIFNFSIPFIIPNVKIPSEDITIDFNETIVDEDDTIFPHKEIDEKNQDPYIKLNLNERPYHVTNFYSKNTNIENSNVVRYYQNGEYIRKKLPKNYRIAEPIMDVKSNKIGLHNCKNCGFYLKGFCEKWKELIRNNYYCNSWINKYERNKVKNMLEMERKS